MTEPLLDLQAIAKAFPGVRALDAVDFALAPGEIHALLGENGAGKSTLVKVLTGVYPRDGGRILFRGRPFHTRGPADAQRQGISTIYQEINLVPFLSVAENIMLGRMPRRMGFIDWRAARARAAASIRRLGVEIDVTRPLASFSIAIQQMAAIARAMDIDSAALIMDEPTSSLDAREADRLFGVLRRLREQGTGIIFITHFLDEVYRITDRITVLRNGRRVGTFDTGALPRIELIGHMLGKSPAEVARLARAETARAGQAERPPPFLVARELGRRHAIAPVTVALRAGEVLGLAGLLGSGRTELARLFFGLDRPTSGQIAIDGRPARLRSPRRAIGHGLGFCPEDRRSQGLIPQLSVGDNIALAAQRRWSRLGLASRRRQRETARSFIERLAIATTGPDQPVAELSGGNQQKVVLARWLALAPRLLILDEPTRGIDVGVKAELEQLVESLARQGMAILFISAELEEVVRRSHRVLVLRDRAVVAELAGSEVTQEKIMNAIAGEAADAPGS